VASSSTLILVKKIPFDFVFDYLGSLPMTVKPMFGMFALYVNEKIMLVLRQRKNRLDTNGVWVATQPQHHASLRKALPSLSSISTYSDGVAETEWQLLPVDAVDFEASVIKVCGLISRGDPRIGRIPKAGKAKRKGAQKNRSSRA
jgi:hypothetical protein